MPIFAERAYGGIVVDVDGNSFIDLGAGIAVRISRTWGTSADSNTITTWIRASTPRDAQPRSRGLDCLGA